VASLTSRSHLGGVGSALVRRKVFGVRAEFVVDVVKAGKDRKREVHMPNRQVIKRRARTPRHWRNHIADCFVNQPIKVKDINCTNDEEQDKERKKYFVVRNESLHCHTYLS